MSLIRFDAVSLEFGDLPLLREADLSIESGERVCLIGRNGAGKSSTFKLITERLQPDSGEIQPRANLVISELEQALPDAGEALVRDVVKSGLARIEALCREYERRSQEHLDARGLAELEELHRHIDSHDGWAIDQRVDTVISDLNLPPDKRMSELSGGWKRRVALARALVPRPDLLLLDEPTNHLDLDTIQWLENRIYAWEGSVLFITHDRTFLQKLATRIIELDRGKLTSWPGDYQNYLRRKEKALEDEATANARFDRKLADEEVWIRQGIKARRTRNEGRARALKSMREERARRVSQPGKARIHIEEAEKSGRKVIQARNIRHGFGEQPLIRDFSVKIMRGDRVGLIGNNGVGKSTLLRILLGELEPQQGSVKLGTNLEIGYFDQLRQDLDPEKTIAENVGDGRDYVKINGRDRHIIGYLKGFLFTPKRALTPVKALSGGERNRVILARLFTRPANLLVLDEPTNDLDMETLEVLEERLVEYSGTLIVVSHDRTFLDNVVTSTLVFEDDGRVHEYVGGYQDWLRHGHRLAEHESPVAATPPVAATQAPAAKPAKRRKLGYREQVELETLPERIEQLELEIGELEARIAEPGFYDGDHVRVKQVLDDLATRNEALQAATERWLELEEATSG